MNKNKLTRKQLKYFSRMAAEAYVNDPVHSYVTKNESFRKRFVYFPAKTALILTKAFSDQCHFSSKTFGQVYFGQKFAR